MKGSWCKDDKISASCIVKVDLSFFMNGSPVCFREHQCISNCLGQGIDYSVKKIYVILKQSFEYVLCDMSYNYITNLLIYRP